MAPRFESTIGLKYAENRDKLLKTGDSWLSDKRNNDEADGYWRIHDDLYDLTDYIDKHPGGKMWLELTKGTDITEAFETHHILTDVTPILAKFHVRRARKPRNSPYTFYNDGFYKTLKKNVRNELKNISKNEKKWKTDLMIDGLVLVTFATSILANYYASVLIGVLAGYFLYATTVAAHNYLHQRDNFRMYYFDFSLMSFREWRIMHVLSHHLLTNTIYDMELSLFEPYLEYLPKKKTFAAKSAVPRFLLICLTLFHLSFIIRIATILSGQTDRLRKSLLIPFILPLAMYILAGQSFLGTLAMWNLIILAGSSFFGFVGLNAAHHHPDIFHDGDTPREDKDWGIMQLDTVMDRKEVTGSLYLVLTTFGDHSLHHLFPTLDHGVLERLYPVFDRTCKDFGIDFRMTSVLDLIKGQFQQLDRESPSRSPPDLLKYCHNK